MLEATVRHLRHDKRGVSNVIVVVLSLVLVVIIVGNIVLWSYQMNQLDWEKMQEKVTLENVNVNRSPWFTAQSEYTINTGSRLSGTYTDTWIVDDQYESFKEEIVPAITIYNPSIYTPIGSTKRISGNIADLTTDNDAYVVFRSYSSTFSSQTTYAHAEVINIAGTGYYQLKIASADLNGAFLTADASTTGRKFLAGFVYPLTGVTQIPTSTWTVYYRSYKTGPDAQVTVHCDLNVIIRKVDGTIRTTIATDVANSSNLNRDWWSTVSGTYNWSSYAVADDTDFLEVDYYAHVMSAEQGRIVYLSIDDSGLPLTDQTRIAGMMMPNSFIVEVEFSGSSDTRAWQSLSWMTDESFTASNVNTTLQLYNYDASQYPANGDGYIAYTSNFTPNTDVTTNQTISINPTYFRGLASEWKIKILGVKQAISPFDLKIDWIEFRPLLQGNCRFDLAGQFALDTSIYPLAYLQSVEIQIRYRASDFSENWFLKAYNWTRGQYSDVGFNSTAGDTPATGFKYYTVNLTSAWQSYVQNGMMKIEFCDNMPDENQTSVDIDFLGVRLVLDGVSLSFRNDGSDTAHIVAIWVTDSTRHTRYSADFFLNSGSSADYFAPSITVAASDFTVRVVTERGNIAVFGKS